MIENPELAEWVEKDSDRLALCGCDLVVETVELDDVPEVDLAAGSQREVQIQQGWLGRGAQLGGALEELPFPYLGGHLAGGGQGLAVLALDFHLEDLVGVLPGADLFVRHEGDESFLEGAETPLDLARGLRRGSHEVGDVQCTQGALELAFRIAVVMARTRAEEAQGVGVDDLRQAVVLKSFAEMQEVVLGGVALDEAPGDAEARAVVNGEQ